MKGSVSELFRDHTMLMGLQKLDFLINNKLENANVASVEEKENQVYKDDVERFHYYVSNISHRKAPKSISRLLKQTKNEIVKSEIFALIMESLVKPQDFINRIDTANMLKPGSSTNLAALSQNEANTDSISIFSLYIEQIPACFPCFQEDMQKTILKGLSDCLTFFTPNTHLNTSQFNFLLYSTLANSCLKIFESYNNEDSPKKLLIKFAKYVLKTAIKIATTLSEYARIKKIQLSTHAAYIGELLPFVAALEQVWDNSDIKLSRLLQQFWICCVIFASSNITLFFSQWEGALTTIANFMPTLFNGSTRGDFAAVKFRIQELRSIMQPVTFTKIQDLIPIFSRSIPNINIKALSEMDLDDGIYALSLFSLERLRAEKGIISPLFKYFEVEYTPQFSAILDQMVEPLFKLFTKALTQFEDPDETSRKANEAMVTFIERYTFPVQRVQNIVDSRFRRFVNQFPYSLFNQKVLHAISKSERALLKTMPDRQQLFKSCLTQMVNKCSSVAPNCFLASIEHLVVSRGKALFYANLPSYINPLIKLLPSDLHDKFLNELTIKCLFYGKIRFATPEIIKQIEDINEKLLMAASYSVYYDDNSLMDILVEPAPPETLFLVWSHCVMNGSMAIGAYMTRLLIVKFLQTIKQKKGIFSNTLDEENIVYQKSILSFFIELSFIGRDMSGLTLIITESFKQNIYMHPASIQVLLPLAQITCFIISSDIHMSIRTSTQMQYLVLDLVLKSYSFIVDHRVFRYIGRPEIKCLEMLVAILDSALLRTSQRAGEMSFKSSQSSYRVDAKMREIHLAMMRSATNYAAEKMPNIKLVQRLSAAISYMLCGELNLFTSYLTQGTDPQTQRLLALHQLKPSTMHMSQTIPVIFNHEPNSVYALLSVPLIHDQIVPLLMKIINKNKFRAISSPELALFFSHQPSFDKKLLSIWSSLSPMKALTLLTPEVMNDEKSASFIARCFASFTKEESLLFIPQLVQSLRFDSCNVMRKFLLKFAYSSEVFSHYLLWNILSEKNNSVNKDDPLPAILQELEQHLIEQMNEAQHQRYEDEFGFIDELDKVSQQLLPLPIPDRPAAFCDMLNDMIIPEGLYIPSNPQYKIISIDATHSVPLKSHARVPILVRFQVYDENDEEKKPFPFACIFKIQDDVRQDALMIQFIDCFKRIFAEAGIDCFLFPYRVFATGKDRGVLEVIPNAKSRHDIGVASHEYLLEYFTSKYGQPGTPAFDKAQDNFIRSMAPNSLLCYIFQVKDRHNANIMIDEEGHIIHIDFGFIFEIAPGGVKFERAPFKLTDEMIKLMGGSKEAAPFQLFRKLLIQCMFAARARHEEFEAIADLMRSAGFKCFKSDSIKKLQERFCVGASPKEVVSKVDELINESYAAITTSAYDMFQAKQNQIFY